MFFHRVDYNNNNNNPVSHNAFAQTEASLLNKMLNSSYNSNLGSSASFSKNDTMPSQKVVNDTTKLQYKITLDKCTPFNKHINDNITLPKIPYSYEKVKTKSISCKEQLSTLASTTCDLLQEGNAYVYNNVFTSICKEPRFVNWYNHYWRTIKDIILQVLSNTDWSGSLGDSTGSSTIAGQGNKNITISSCKGDDTNYYSIVVGKRDSDESKHVTLNVIANASSIPGKDNIYSGVHRNMASPQIESTHTTNAPFGSVSASGQC